MFEHFSVATRDVVIRAADEARGLGDEAVGPEHLLLGLLTEGGAAGRVLISAGLTREAVQARLGREGRSAQGAGGHMPLTYVARQALERATQRATAAGDDRVTPEHLLLGLTDTADGVTAELLRDARVDPNTA